MIASTLPIALCVVCLIYFPIMQRLAWRWLCYALVALAAFAFLRQKAVHMQYVGIEIAALGCLLIYLDPLRFVRKGEKSETPIG